MIKETVVTAKTVEAAVEAGARQLGREVAEVKYEVLEEASKGFFGLGANDAKVKVTYEVTREELGKAFLETVLADMGLTGTVVSETVSEDGEECIRLSVNGENMGVLIGRHGEALEALQYLAGFAANREGGDYIRVRVDVENYRAKREEALRILARRTAEKVRKFRRSFTLEPMSSYERRIIHAEVQNIKGVTTYSVGQGADRKVVVAVEKDAKNS